MHHRVSQYNVLYSVQQRDINKAPGNKITPPPHTLHYQTKKNRLEIMYKDQTFQFIDLQRASQWLNKSSGLKISLKGLFVYLETFTIFNLIAMKKENQFDSQIYITNEIFLSHCHNFQQNKLTQFEFSEAEFKEFESRLIFKLLL